ncbi:MAG: threonine--tRNA ligase [Clostridiales bacterium]|jgi:threonyl-tRNA synthetase|nr:threonine--tRNA ligase [Clostridiales bacterium]HOK81183.1 threonine--tRNA ligase [Clostridia bacterium]HOL60302.1 threonine--tRNA ligase [Clostridia bacterium]HPO53059.1 threonine--tRNA ligase [Clostridia bacterium]
MIITLRDEKREFPAGTTPMDIARSISEGLAKNALCARVNGKTVGLYTPIESDSEVEILTFDDEEGRKAFRHSASHVLAQAVKRIYPTARLAIGPAIQNGFYYDFEFKTPISMEDLEAIEAEMKKIVKEHIPIVRETITRAEALRFFRDADEPYKVELISDLPEDAEITMYRQGDFIDLCAGPHVPNTAYIKSFKLTSLTGAYWKGDEHNKMLTRIYGTAFAKKSDLEDYLAKMEEAKQRDHNKLGRELGFFMTDENIGQGLPLLMPKGAKLFQILSRFVEDEEERRGYIRTKTPYMAKSQLYKISGHWDHYRDGMFVMGDEEKDDEVFALRPMTCPFQYTIYNNGLKSYRDLPKRYGETSTLFRNESSGEMHGLIRVRQFTISEGHIVCTPSQLEQEFRGALDLALYMLKCLGLYEDVSFRFSKWDPNNKEKYIDDPAEWEYAESEMKRILDHIGLKYSVGIGEAAFYGPKLDIQIRNVHGKEDTLITIQIDMFLAERFNMSYIDENGDKVRPYIIHRTSIGCYERTMALLIEKYKAAFPVWFAPVQVRVLSLTDRTVPEVNEAMDILYSKGIRAEADIRNEKIGYKIREAQVEKVPYMLIIGDKEKENGVVAVRSRSEGDLGTMTLEAFLEKIKYEIDNKVIK